MRKRAKTRTPTRRSDRKRIDGALLPATVVVLVVVVVVVTVVVCPVTTAVVLDTAVATPLELCAVTSARNRWPTSADRTP